MPKNHNQPKVNIPKKTIQCNFFIDEVLAGKIIEEANKRGRRFNTVARELLEEHLGTRETEKQIKGERGEERRALPATNAEQSCLELFRQFDDPIKALEGMRWNLIAEKKDLLSNISKTVDLSQEKTSRPAKKRPHAG